MKPEQYSCGSREHFDRRSILKLAGLSGMSWLTPLANCLARSESRTKSGRAKSLILLWMEGAPSQLETFDPHPGTEIAAGSKARDTKVPGIQIGDGLEQVAEEMDSISLVRAVTSKEGDHERAIYNVKTGYRPDPTLIHPAIGSVICHQIHDEPSAVDIPRHISILPASTPARGGYLGGNYDAFKVFDPLNSVPDVTARVGQDRQDRRITNLRFADEQFLRHRINNRMVGRRLQQSNLDPALSMMTSEQLKAFDVSQVPYQDRLQFGATAFGRGCLAAIQLVEAGVRCIEVTLTGWDTHVNNHELQAGRVDVLDPAFASLIRELKKRDLLETTMVVCGGEFGRTPYMNSVGGRDHWPHGFTIAMAGGGIQGGRVVGETSPQPDRKSPLKSLHDAHSVSDIHATVFHAMGIKGELELDTPIGRPIRLTEGKPIQRLF
ncbi:MAG: DUF1501 domain-containing protein [Planctomycetota bacterium]